MRDTVHVELNADGSATLTLASGETLIVPAASVEIADGVVFVDKAFFADGFFAESVGSASGIGAAPIVLAVAGAGGAAVALLGREEADEPPPQAPQPTLAAPVFKSPASTSVQENQLSVMTVLASDDDGDRLSYSISGGDDAAKFEIDQASGALSFASPPDFENAADKGGDNAYNLTVSATDGVHTTSQDIVVNVTNLSDSAPVITSSSEVIVAENSASIMTVTATDGDGDVLHFEIVGGADAALFKIDTQTGALAFVAAQDAEAPNDADNDNIYEVVVSVFDGLEETRQTISVMVDNANDNAPQFSSGNFARALEGGADAGYTASAMDEDGDPIFFSIAGGADAAQFMIDEVTGVLSFVSPPDADAPRDADGDNIYDVIVRASDGANATDQSVSVTVAREVSPNAHAPVFTSGAESHALENGVSTGYTAVASDDDGDQLTYFLLGGADASRLEIDSNTGELTFINAPDAERPIDIDRDNVYELTVGASDGVKQATQTLFVTVDNENDNKPILISAAVVNVSENILETGYVAAALDADDFAPNGANASNSTITYNISGGADAAQFVIDSNTGALLFASAPDAESPRDSDRDNTYELIVSASDSVFEDTQAVSVTVANVNDNAPIFFSVGAASAQEGDVATGYVAEAIDADGEPVTYQIAGGDDAAQFSIDANTGALLFAIPTDHDAPRDSNGDNVYSLIVSATDGTNTTFQNVAVAVAEFGDKAPVFTSASTMTAQENHLSTGYVAAATASGPLTYSLVAGADVALFSIDAVSGAVSFTERVSFEAPKDTDGDNVYDIVVRASNSGSFTDQSISISVADVTEAYELFGGTNLGRFGEAVSFINDIDGDGYNEFVIGESNGNGVSIFNAGAVYIVLSSSLADHTDGVIDLSDAKDDGVVIAGAVGHGLTGDGVVNVGDFDGDGLDELLVSAPRDVANGVDHAGVSYLIYGKSIADHLGGTLDLANLGSSGVEFRGGYFGGQSGYSIASAGDVNGDGVDDLIIGAPFADSHGREDAGAAYIIFGDNIAKDADGVIDLAALGQNGVTLTGPAALSLAGSSVSSAGDVDGDGLDDVIVGAPFTVPASLLSAPPAETGEAFLVFGSALTRNSGGEIDLTNLGENGVHISGHHQGGAFGGAIASLGDIDGDGLDDIAIGASRANSNDYSGSGETYIVFGSVLASDADGVVNVAGAGGGVITIKGPGNYQQTGLVITSAGDLDGDGIGDLLIGAQLSSSTVLQEGASYVVFGAAMLADADGVIDLAADLGSSVVRLDGGVQGHQSGASIVSIGDTDGDGLDDILIGAPGAEQPDRSSLLEGKAYIISGALVADEIGDDGILDLNSSVGVV